MGITEQIKSGRDRSLGMQVHMDRLEQLEEMLQKYGTDGQRQAIVIKILKNDIPVFEGIYGHNNGEYRLRYDTIFQVSSISKPVIATLMLCLQEDGLVDLTEPVYKYLPEFSGGGKECICLWHFLTHSSGITDEMIENNFQEQLKIWGLQDTSWTNSRVEKQKQLQGLREKLGCDPKQNGRLGDPYYLISLQTKLSQGPRKEMVYCSYGFQMMKWIIEEVTGQTIDQYACERLFGPLGMKDTYFIVPEEKWYKIIQREESAVAANWFNSDVNKTNDNGAGGLKTTVNDMIRFCRMIQKEGTLDGKRILSPGSIRHMLRNYNAEVISNGSKEYANWGLGWNLNGDKMDDAGMLRSFRAADHSGFGGTKILIDPEKDVVLVCFTVENVLFSDKEFFGINGRIVNTFYSAFDD